MHVTSNHLQTPIDDNDQNIKIVHKLVQQKVHQKISDKLDQVQHTEKETNDHFGSRQILIDDSDHHSTNYINNNLKIVNQKRRRFSRDRTVSDDATLLVTQPTSTEPVFDSSNIINNSFDCDSNEKIIKTIECHSSSTTLNDSNLPKNYHVSLPSLNTSTLTKSVAFDPITTIKVDDDNVIYNLTSRFQLQSIFLRNHSHRSSNNYQTAKSTKQPLSILKSSKSTSIYFDGHRKTCPKKSEQILFDPKRSAADLFVDNQTNLNDSIDQQISLGLSKDSTLRLRSLDDISDCDNSTFSSIDSHINDDVDDGYHSNNIRSYVSNSQSSKSTTTTSSYCDCSSNEIQPITYRVCLNCHKPLSYFNDDSIAGKECSNLLHGTSSIPLISIDNHLSTDRRVYQLASQRPTNNVAYRPIINENTIDAITLDLIGPSSDESLFQDSSTFLMMTNDEDDDMDRPQFCHKCNIWYGSLDPSYPITCHCPEMIKSNAMNMNDSGSIYSVHMRKDFRYYFQHPYSRLFVAYFVIFCNFLIFAEDPLSHSLMECSIPVLGNVISLLFTKYPPEFEWRFIKASMSISAIILGLFIGKFFLHHIVLRRILRLKMFREESGTWMIMLISSVLSCYFASQIYNALLLMFHPAFHSYLITSKMGITYALFMKIAACGTWCGDFFTAWMITDMMLQDNLYPKWAIGLREFWYKHANIRILVFWSGSLVIAASVITIILTEVICWDCITYGLFSTTEFSRAFLASAILVMDLLIVMQDWDFPHFVCDLNIKLPGLLQPSYTLNFFRKSLKFPPVEIKITGKWFNYGIIVFVMMLDLNMWKNQVIYYPSNYGQYVETITNRVCSITDQKSIDILHRGDGLIDWSYENRSRMIDPQTNRTYIQEDLIIYARYFGYPWVYKMASLIPILAGFAFFLFLVYFYGRFPPKTDASLGGRLPKRRSYRSSWRRERRDNRLRINHRKRHISWPGLNTVFEKYQNRYDLSLPNKMPNDVDIDAKISSANYQDKLFEQNEHNHIITDTKIDNISNSNAQKTSLNSDNNCNSKSNLPLNPLINILTPISSRFILSLPSNPLKICAFIMPITTNGKVNNKVDEDIDLNPVNTVENTHQSSQPTTI
ncbi:hypothetical protein DERP_001124 [Dermatophagoides pteronyssinus]|uniref:Transmembrane protein 117-like n=2 Tax=Dermatophagoides pteronyssinus TaxID=6956 RepID=A0ABQ8JE29_DERPT|nr:hypothetical protein DERP_001124 [Dermatophagoides pteronyssinus]